MTIARRKSLFSFNSAKELEVHGEREKNKNLSPGRSMKRKSQIGKVYRFFMLNSFPLIWLKPLHFIIKKIKNVKKCSWLTQQQQWFAFLFKQFFSSLIFPSSRLLPQAFECKVMTTTMMMIKKSNPSCQHYFASSW